jgi:hypothetical protein
MGKPIPFDSEVNFLRFSKCFKHGSYEPLFSALVHATNRAVSRISDELYEPDPVLNYFTGLQSLYFNWVRGSSLYTRAVNMDLDPRVYEYSLGLFDPMSSRGDAIGRLVQEGLLVTETQLLVAMHHNILTKRLSTADTWLGTAEWTESSLSKVMCCAESSSICKRLVTDPDLTKPSPIQVRNFLNSIGSTRNLGRVLRQENVFLREALDLIYTKGIMMTTTNFMVNPKVQWTKFTYIEAWEKELDIPDTEERGALDELLEYVRDPNGPAPTRMVNDDNSIIERCLNLPNPTWGICVATDDKQLMRDISRAVPNRYLIRVPVEFYYRVVYYGNGFDQEGFSEFLPKHKKWHFIEDQGSIDSGEERLWKDGVFYPNGVYSSYPDLRRPWHLSAGTDRELSPMNEANIFNVPVNWTWDYSYFNSKGSRWFRPKPGETIV